VYLKKIELLGFKSFANKTVIDFMPTNSDKNKIGSFRSGKKTEKNRRTGITAIVGPNGSGKSNVADAIRWAMGEQSMKNLRGKKSEDVIFAGSGKKSKLSYAMVSLHFDNSDKKIPLDFSEVIVKRKLFRSGESEYMINGSRVRLIDIIDLLAKAGVGKDSYSVLNQGMSDAILNATPAERRTILEDAAGVKQYQIKKMRALKKLETTYKNLEQAKGLLNEIEPHLRSLKRQAGKAQKGKEIKAELKKTQKKYFAYLWHNFQAEKEKSFQEKENLGTEMMTSQKKVDQLNDFILAESKKMRQNKKPDELKKQRDELYGKLNNLEKDVAVTEGKIEILRERIQQQNIVQSIPVDKRYIQGELAQVYKAQKKLVKIILQIKNIKDLQQIKENAREVERKIFELRGDIEKGKVDGKRTAEQIAEEKKMKKTIDEAGLWKKKLFEKIKFVKNKIAKIGQEIEMEIQKDNESRREFFKAEDELREKQQALNSLKDKFNEAKISLARVEVREEDLISDAKNSLGIEIQNLKYDGEEIKTYEVERKIFRMKSQLEQIGGIDTLVVEEYEETNQRYETLQQESEDLQKAIFSLRKVVKEMDKKIDKVFIEAFEQINKEFSKYFRIIFGGGKAQLKKTKKLKKKKKKKELESLEATINVENEELNNFSEIEDDNSENEEEIGVEISACPPGKKIANLSMLSGGERSLTSLALLFAIISFNPPPFAVLDEVEAALDEANSLRFGKILQELSGNTQFVAITHNRETMRQASYLYGATMDNDGITKLLSVKLDEIGE